MEISIEDPMRLKKEWKRTNSLKQDIEECVTHIKKRLWNVKR